MVINEKICKKTLRTMHNSKITQAHFGNTNILFWCIATVLCHLSTPNINSMCTQGGYLTKETHYMCFVSDTMYGTTRWCHSLWFLAPSVFFITDSLDGIMKTFISLFPWEVTLGLPSPAPLKFQRLNPGKQPLCHFRCCEKLLRLLSKKASQVECLSRAPLFLSPAWIYFL